MRSDGIVGIGESRTVRPGPVDTDIITISYISCTCLPGIIYPEVAGSVLGRDGIGGNILYR